MQSSYGNSAVLIVPRLNVIVNELDLRVDLWGMILQLKAKNLHRYVCYHLSYSVKHPWKAVVTKRCTTGSRQRYDDTVATDKHRWQISAFSWRIIPYRPQDSYTRIQFVHDSIQPRDNNTAQTLGCYILP